MSVRMKIVSISHNSVTQRTLEPLRQIWILSLELHKPFMSFKFLNDKQTAKTQLSKYPTTNNNDLGIQEQLD